MSDVPARFAWLAALRQPELALGWSLSEWQRVIRLSRRLRLLARLAEALDSQGHMPRVPDPARRLLIGEQRLSRARTAAAVWAAQRVAAALQAAPYACVLLKGGAYLGQQLPIAAGRLPSDLDILVPKAHIADAQSRLIKAGWAETQMDAHDQRYYHEWSHEVPPMQHPIHGLELDLHHNILPPVARTHVDADLLLARLRPSAWPGWSVFDPLDQVLHSAAHLFLDAEPRERVRDLVDLDGLMRHFGATQPGFWAELPRRARQLGLSEPLALACYFVRLWLATPIPPEALELIEQAGPGVIRRAWLVPLFSVLLTPAEPDDAQSLGQKLAALLVLARYHRQRMPLRLLVPHLWHKWRAGRLLDSGAVEGKAAP